MNDRINTSNAPSRLIDVGQWLVLFRVLLESAGSETDRRRARLLGFEAAQCLEEALKFYGPDNDLPPESACFSEGSLQRLRHHPQLFARSRLVNLRAKLPSPSVMERSVLKDRKAVVPPRPWWKFW